MYEPINLGVVTTSKHITQWLEGIKAKTVEQSFLDNLLGA